MAMEWGGGGGHGTGPESRLGRQEVRARGDRRGEGKRGEHENKLPLGGRVLGHVRLYGERGRGAEERRAPRKPTRDQEQQKDRRA